MEKQIATIDIGKKEINGELLVYQQNIIDFVLSIEDIKALIGVFEIIKCCRDGEKTQLIKVFAKQLTK